MGKKDGYLDIARNLSDYIKSQRGIVDEIQRNIKRFETFSNFKSLESFFSKLDEINSFKFLLPKIDVDSQALQLIRQTNEAISKLSLSTKLQSLIMEAPNISNLWKKQFADIPSLSKSIEPVLIELQSQIARISEISILAERTLASIDFSRLGEEYNISVRLKNNIQDTSFAFTESYSNLFSLFKENQLGILSYPPAVSIIPPIEFYLNSRSLWSIEDIEKETPEDTILTQELTKETTDEIESLLSELDAELIKLWRGAKDALIFPNPDSIRHFSVSLRELLTCIIHKLSPEDRIAAWSNSPDLFHNGRPTRKARLLYICKGINLPPFDDFILKDIGALLACIDIFQKGTHAISPSLNKTQTDLLLLRVESHIRFLLRIWKETGSEN